MIEGMVMVWLIAFIAFLILEVATVGLVSIWFCVGAFAAMIASTFNLTPMMQLGVFFAVSIVLLIATKPFVKDILKIKIVRTNADKILNEIGVVTEEIDNKKGTGTIKIDGKEWTARSDNGKVIEMGKNVKINEIQGVKVIVTLD